MYLQVTVPAAIVPIKLPPPHLSLPKNSSRVRSSSVGSNDSSMASPTVSSSGSINEEIQQSSVDFTEKTTKSFDFTEKTTKSFGFTEKQTATKSFGFTEKTKSSPPQQPGPVIYRWDDESNGEIYTDRTLAATGTGNAAGNDADEDNIEHNNIDLTENNENSSNNPGSSSIGLYVVENGKEYPLLPIR